jgi:hypothetical protein
MQTHRVMRCQGAHIFFLDNWLTDGSKVDSLTCRLRCTTQKYFLLLISVRGCVNPRTIVRLERWFDVEFYKVNTLNTEYWKRECEFVLTGIVIDTTYGYYVCTYNVEEQFYIKYTKTYLGLI